MIVKYVNPAAGKLEADVAVVPREEYWALS